MRALDDTSLTIEDEVVALRIINDLLNAQWTPSDDQVNRLRDAQRSLFRSVLLNSGREAMQSAFDAAIAVEALAEISIGSPLKRSTVEQILTTIDAFPACASILAERQRGRRGFQVDDEYDVQDVFRALMLPVIPDLVPEDPAPKVAGRSSRLDFVSRHLRTGFEIKHLKSVNDVKRAREEILLDERTYQAHPYIDSVIVFISDPAKYMPLADRPSFEADLSQTVRVGDRTVQYTIRVR